jgi:hypothetical protein
MTQRQRLPHRRSSASFAFQCGRVPYICTLSHFPACNSAYRSTSYAGPCCAILTVKQCPRSVPRSTSPPLAPLDQRHDHRQNNVAGTCGAN